MPSISVQCIPSLIIGISTRLTTHTQRHNNYQIHPPRPFSALHCIGIIARVSSDQLSCACCAWVNNDSISAVVGNRLQPGINVGFRLSPRPPPGQSKKTRRIDYSKTSVSSLLLKIPQFWESEARVASGRMIESKKERKKQLS